MGNHSFCILLYYFFYGVGVGVYQWPPYTFLNNCKVALEEKYNDYQQLYVSHGEAYLIKTSVYSYFALDNRGNFILKDSLPYQAEGIYEFDRTIYPNKTAIIIMDPWIDMATDFLNNYYGEVLDSYIIPLVKSALNRGHPIIVLTNDPETVKYNSKIHPELEALVLNNKISMLYHSDYKEEDFAEYLRSQDIDSLIYTGFASNMCLIGRELGMIYMQEQGFRIFFVPDASAAVELADTWNSNYIHNTSTKIISQWIAELIDYKELMSALDNN